jgi:hypothetical protein
MKPGDLVMVEKTNTYYGGYVGVVIAHPVSPTPELRKWVEPDEVYSSVMLEGGIILECISSDWLEVLSETG